LKFHRLFQENCSLVSLPALSPLFEESAFDEQYWMIPPVVQGDRSTGIITMAFLSTMPPRRCGLAMFTADLIDAVNIAAPHINTLRVTMADDAATNPRSPLQIPSQERPAYRRTARELNRGRIDLLCVQHEFGIFGGPDGEMLLDFLDEVKAPIVVTLHTVLDLPTPGQRRIMDALARRAARLVVMTRQAADIMRRVYGIGEDRLRVVPHGIPAPPHESREACRRELGVGSRPLLLTFGLLSPGKGVQHALRALPAICKERPGVLYLVLGATHPNLLKEQGEAYRNSLQRLVDELGVRRNVRLVNRFVDLPELRRALAATDIYLTPYVNEAQSVSGTLAYSYGMGAAVVSTPYRHAAELLADGNGVLVPFADSGAIAAAVSGLLGNPGRLTAMRLKGRAAGQRMQWPAIGERYVDIFREAIATGPLLAAGVGNAECA
jgi:glycosyltransferase involved in cell wall biosynthesis